MEKYKIQNAEELNGELILQLINRYKLKEVTRLKRLKNYYTGKHETIINRTMKDPTKPNNKIINPYATYIVDTIGGYFLGKPVNYASSEEEQMKKIQYVFDSNDEQSLNSRIGKDVSIFGVGYELHYTDENSETKMAYLDPQETFMVHDNSIQSKPLAAVRFYEVENYKTQQSVLYAEVYDKDFIYSYIQEKDEFRLVDEPEQHYYKEVPVIQYLNNDETIGDFENVLKLIDAYDLSTSDQMNSLEYFADAYLVLSGIEAESEDLEAMKENRVMLMGEKGTADFLMKGDIAGVKEYTERLKQDIHTFSFVPNISDESFGTSSGEALKFKLFGLESAVSVKERFFKKGLEKRLKLITKFLNTKGGSYDSNSITMSFTRNMPSNNETIANIIEKLSGILSDKTLISLLPFIEDSAYEIELREKEKEGSLYESLGK
ncbi:phage portal protein [Planococcus sp. ANT_H30]|uniref:phage portal protein n=1 Tax=Planococcus sp. ANT_H30 TaxID=2597347 RepID=UPI00165E0337|nr:phage portal protein [Planococcus sp. ANT_H30]